MGNGQTAASGFEVISDLIRSSVVLIWLTEVKAVMQEIRLLLLDLRNLHEELRDIQQGVRSMARLLIVQPQEGGFESQESLRDRAKREHFLTFGWLEGEDMKN